MPKARHPRSKKKEQLAQALMNDWAASQACDLDDLHDLFGLQALAMRSEAESGDCIVVRQFERHPRLAVPLRLRLLEGDFIDHLRDGAVDGYEAVQGVAFDAQARRLGYYLHSSHPGDRKATYNGSRFVSADQVAHLYDVRRPGQVRGIPRGVAAMNRMRNLDDFQDARLEQQKIAACLAMLIQQGEEGQEKGDVLPEKLEPGLIARLGQDETVGAVTPPSVSGQDTFVRSEERLIAKAYGITYEALTGDLSTANFANAKIGRLDMYSHVRRLRRHMLVPRLCNRISDWFVQAAVLAGYDIEGVTFRWNPPRSEILNLRDDIPALTKQIRAGLGSWSEIARSLGYADTRALLDEIADDFKAFDALGLVLDSDPRRTTTSGQLQMELPAPDDHGTGIDP